MRAAGAKNRSRGDSHIFPVPVFLGATVSLALVNGWLVARTGKLRRQVGISVGHGGNEALLRRMRAQANFVETAPLVLFLILALELCSANRIALAMIAALFILARISHAVGMEGGEKSRWRMYGMMATSLTTITLILWGIVCLARACLCR